MEELDTELRLMRTKIMHKSFYFSVIAILMLVHFGCRNSNKPQSNSKVQELVKALEQKAIACDATLPDSAERYLLKGIEVSEAARYEEGKLKMHSLLAEFYQYRIIDTRLAYVHLNEAIQLYLRNPSYRVYNTYLFTDIGNVQLKSGFIQEALENYHSALLSAECAKDSFGIVLAYNNIGLVWQQLKRADSARSNFTKAAELLNDTKLTKAQNLFYQMRLAAEQGHIDMLPIFGTQIQQAIDSFVAYKGGFDKLSEPESLHLLKVRGEAEGVLADFGKQPDKEKYLRSSVAFAIQSYTPDLIHRRQLALGSYQLAQGHIQEVQLIVDSLWGLSHLLRDADFKLRIYQLQLELATFIGDQSLRLRTEQSIYRISDSLAHQGSDLKLMKEKLAVSSVNARLAVENMKTEALSSKKTIEQQKTFIYFLLIVLVLLLGSLVVIALHRKRKRLLRNTQPAQMIPLSNTHIHAKMVGHEKDSLIRPGIEGLQIKLETLNKNDKPFLNPDLTLDDLAALLGTNHTYLSSFINHRFGINFNDYLNSLRVEHACTLLLTQGQQLSMDQVYERSGFHSRSTFYAAFKKHTGVTPAAYLKMEQKEQRKAL